MIQSEGEDFGETDTQRDRETDREREQETERGGHTDRQIKGTRDRGDTHRQTNKGDKR